MTSFSSPITSAPTTSESTETVQAVGDSHSKSIPDSIINFSKEHNRPYTTEHFKILEYRDIYGKPDADIEGLMPKIDAIEQYVKNSIEERGLQDTKESYEFLMKEIVKKIGKQPTEDIRHLFHRVAIYASKNSDVKGQLTREAILQSLKEIETKLQ